MADIAPQSLMEPTTTRDWDAIVIGAGVLGTFHAYFAACRGLRTLLIERSDLPREASVRNFGTLVPSAMPPGEWHRRALQSARTYFELAGQIRIPLQKGGTQYLATTPAEAQVLAEFAALGRERGYRCDLLDGLQSVALSPAVDPANCHASLHFPDDLRVDPRAVFAALIGHLVRDLGCAYLPRTVATGAQVKGGECRITTAAGEVHRAPHAFICTGADFRALLPDLFARSGMLRCKLQMMRTVPQATARIPVTLASGLSIRWYPSFQICPSWQMLREEPVDGEVSRRGIHVLLVQDEDSRVVVGDSHEYSSHELSETLDARTDELILAQARRLVRLDRWDICQRWHGVYAMHPDQPLFRQSIDGRLHVVTGIGGKGMTTGPAVARESIDAIAGDASQATARG